VLWRVKSPLPQKKGIEEQHDELNIRKKNIPFREVAVRGDGDLALLPCNGNGIAECTGLAADLNPLLKKLLERSNVHNLVLHRLRAIDHEA